MTRTSAISGTRSRVTGSSTRRAAAMIGRAAFFAPLEGRTPSSFFPPRMTSRVMVPLSNNLRFFDQDNHLIIVYLYETGTDILPDFLHTFFDVLHCFLFKC